MRIAGASAAGGAAKGPSPAGVILGVLVLVAGVVLGHAGQSRVTIGAPANVSVIATVTSSSGGIGRLQPVRVQLQASMINTGSSAVRVVGGWEDTVSTAIKGLTPSEVEVPPGQRTDFSIDVAVVCSWPQELTLPMLRVQEPNGERAAVPLSGTSALVQACARGREESRPLTVGTITTTPVDGAKLLSVELDSPTGRPADIRSISAGGVLLTARNAQDVGTTGAPVHVAGGGAPSVVRLSAPATCPPAWLNAGLPTELQLQLADQTLYPLRIGPPLAAWLLATACRPGGPS